MQSSDNIRTLIAHEDPIVAAGLMTVLKSQPEFSVRVASSLAALLQSCVCQLQRLEVVVADYQTALKILGQIEASGQAGNPEAPRVLVVTQMSREWDVRCAMNAGVFGYVLQSCGIEEIVSGVRFVGASRRYMCEEVTERIAESLTRVTLTVRETEVLELIRRGMCNKAIARDLGIAPGTVKAHVKGILEKLESSTRTQAVAVATYRGLIKVSVEQSDALGVRHARDDVSPSYQAGASKSEAVFA